MIAQTFLTDTPLAKTYKQKTLTRARRLTKNQTRRLQERFHSPSDGARIGHLVANFGRKILVQDAQGTLHDCAIRTTLPALCVGDKVWFHPKHGASGAFIDAFFERENALYRPDRYHKQKPICANVDILAIVFCPRPVYSLELIDRYLIAARHGGITPLLVANKMDLAPKGFLDAFMHYCALGIDLITTSKDDPSALLKCAYDKTLILAGQSGVGKSTLVNHLLPDSNQATHALSHACDLGQHTTTSSRFLTFGPDPAQGGIIDTPGIREYGLWHLSKETILAQMDELAHLAGDCRFGDCAHTQKTPGCALWAGVEMGNVHLSRLIHYLKFAQDAKG